MSITINNVSYPMPIPSVKMALKRMQTEEYFDWTNALLEIIGKYSTVQKIRVGTIFLYVF